MDQHLIETTDEVNLFAICRNGDGTRERYVLGTAGYATPAYSSAALVKGGDGTFALTGYDGSQRHFDADGKLLSVADRNQNRLTFEYDATGFMTAVHDDAGRRVSLTRGATGKIDSITDPAGRRFQYAYDANGNLTRVTDATGGITQYRYDSNQRLMQVIDPNNHVIQNLQYDSIGRVIGYMEDGAACTVAYSPDQMMATKTDAEGNVYQVYYNDKGSITKIVDPLGFTTESVYDANYNVVRRVDQNGDAWTYTYDARHNLLTATDPIGNTKRFSYDPVFSRVTSSTDALGNVTTSALDENGNVISRTDPAGNATQFTYDTRGLLTSVVDPLSHTTAFKYDQFGNLTESTDPLGNRWSYTSDAVGNRTLATDSLGHATTYAYDGKNRLTRITLANGGIVNFAYDAAGDVVRLVDARGKTTTYSYDSVSRLQSISNPLSQKKTFVYELRGKIVSVTDAKNQVTANEYDALGRLVRQVYPGDEVRFVYNPRGQLISATDSASRLVFAYDHRGLLTEAKTLASNAGGEATAITYDYDANGDRISMSDWRGNTTTYAYDAVRRLVGMKSSAGFEATFQYDAAGRRIGMNRTGGATTSYMYDAAGQLLSLSYESAAGQSRFDYTYDAAGNRLTLTDSVGTHLFGYDQVNQLISAGHPQAQQQNELYAYDLAGNRTSSHLSNTYSYDEANRLLADARFDYSYDANGNLTIKRERSTGQLTRLTYDAQNRLIGVITPDGSIATSRYDSSGRRIEHVVNGQTTRYVYDGQNLLAKSAANTGISLYFYGRHLDELFGYSESGGLLVLTEADAVGSIQREIGPTAKITTYAYDTFGNITSENAPQDSHLLFQARELDPDSGLYYFRARFYSPIVGRFISEDPIGRLDQTSRLAGVSQYEYVANNPILFKDPNGLTPFPGYNWCGPGNREGACGNNLPPTTLFDACCAAHDLCYNDCGTQYGGVPTSVGGIACRAACDAALTLCIISIGFLP